MKKTAFTLLFTLTFAQITLNAQVIFERRYGTESKDYEQVSDAVTTTDGGLLLGGNTESDGLGAYDMFLHKINADGSDAWFKTYGGADLDVLTGLIPAAGGGYFFTGYGVNPQDGSFDAWLLKLNENGDSLWRRSVSTPASDVALGLCQMANGNVVVMGFTTNAAHKSVIFRALYDPNGVLVNYASEITTSDVDNIKIRPTTDGGFIALLSEGFFGGTPVLKKYSNLFNPQWSVPVTGLGAQFGEVTNAVYDLQTTVNGVVFLAQGNNGTFLIRINLIGMLEWHQRAAGFAYGANLQVFPGDNIRVGVATSSAMVFRRYSQLGTPQDSTGLGLTFSPQSMPRFLFPNETQCFYIHNATFLQQEDYFAAFFDNLATPAISWQQTFGETGLPDAETGKSIVSLPDGGFVMLGTKENASGDHDLWLLKADEQGDILWEKTVSLGLGSFDDAEPGSVDVDAAGNIIVLAATSDYQGDLRLLQFSPQGDSIFDRTLVVAENYLPEYFRVRAIPGDGFIVCYTRDYDGDAPTPTLFRLNNSGNLVWEKNYDGEELMDIVVLSDGGFAVVGQKNNTAWMFRTDNNGNVLWDKTYSASVFSRFVSVQQAANGNLFAGGISVNPAALEAKALLLKADSDGNILWLKQHSKGAGTYWEATTVLPDSDGSCCFVGGFAAPPANLNAFSSIFRSRISVSKADADGNLVVNQSYGTDGTFPTAGTADKTSDGNVIFVASLNGSFSLQDAWVVKTDCSQGVVSVATQLKSGQYSLAPNPALDATQIQLTSEYRGSMQVRMFDALGREVFNRPFEKTEERWQQSLELTGLAPGLYWVQVTAGGERLMQLLAVQK